MGGKAFLTTIPDAVFPRMPTETYSELKARHLAQLQSLFRLVGVPREAPGKETHGDIDYIVWGPLSRTAREDLKTSLGAEYVLSESHTTNLAVRMDGQVTEGAAFYQVDVHACKDEGEWGRVMFFHSYGDLGMILGVVARNNGLSMGEHGLKIPAQGSVAVAPFLLSADFKRIMEFYELDLDVWKAGFETQREVFEWVATSPLFDVATFKESAHREKRREDRKMYQAFLRWVIEQKDNGEKARPVSEDVVEKAKEFFGMKGAYEEEVERGLRRRRVKEALSGKMVMEWTGLEGPVVGEVIRAVKESMDEDTLLTLTRDQMRSRVLNAAKNV